VTARGAGWTVTGFGPGAPECDCGMPHLGGTEHADECPRGVWENNPALRGGPPMGPRPAATRRRTIEEIEAPMRAKGTIGCRCLCAVLHPARVGICTGAAERNVPLRAEWNTPDGKVVDVSMCEACYGALGQ
jgi:hypothetical protein